MCSPSAPQMAELLPGQQAVALEINFTPCCACCLQRPLQQANQKKLPVTLGLVLVVLVLLSLPGTPGLPHRGMTLHCICPPHHQTTPLHCICAMMPSAASLSQFVLHIIKVQHFTAIVIPITEVQAFTAFVLHINT